MSGIKYNLNNKQKLKLRVIKIVLWALGRGFLGCSKHDDNMKNKLKDWQEGTSVLLKVPGGVSLLLEKKGELIYPRKVIKGEKPYVTITFKSIESAFSVMTGQMGIWQANAQHRFTLKGDIYFGMSLVRCIDIIENYLFPSFITKKIIRKRPEKSVSSIKIYLSLIFG